MKMFVLAPALSAALALTASVAQAQPAVSIYTTSAEPVALGSRNARVVYLDDVQRLQKALGAGLPSDPQAAEAIMRQRIDSADGRRMQADLQGAYEGLFEAQRLGIDRLPAVDVVHNGRHHVIYGARTMDAALATFQRWQQSQPCREGEACVYSTTP